MLANEDINYVPYDVKGEYGQLFDIIARRLVIQSCIGTSGVADKYFILWVVSDASLASFRNNKLC